MLKKPFLLFCLFICSHYGFSQAVVIQNITFDPYMHLACNAFYKKLEISSTGSDADFINGFTFEWGYTYKVKIKKIKLKQPPSDGSDTRSELVKVISKTGVPVDYQFAMKLDNELYPGPGEQSPTLAALNDSSFRYFDSIRIHVPSQLLEKFKNILNRKVTKTATFRFGTDHNIKLISRNNCFPDSRCGIIAGFIINSSNLHHCDLVSLNDSKS